MQFDPRAASGTQVIHIYVKLYEIRSDTMSIRIVTLGKITALLIILSLGLPIPSQAAVYWRIALSLEKQDFLSQEECRTRPIRSIQDHRH